MTRTSKVNRRSFVIGSTAAGTGLALGFDLPFGSDAVRAADVPPEVDAWVVIKPDETVVIRIARSEMGQGTMTGLAQLVAEELDADWSKVTTEFPTPGQNLARKRVWGDFSTGGSRGIRDSNKYVREGGAAARMMLIQAAANDWNVPAAECTAVNRRDHTQSVGPHCHLRQSGGGRRQARCAQGRGIERPEDVDDRRQATQAARYAQTRLSARRSSASTSVSRE